MPRSWQLLAACAAVLAAASCDDTRRSAPGGGGNDNTTRRDAGTSSASDGGRSDGGAAPIDAGPTDPRCEQGCAIHVPEQDGVGEVCSALSAAFCKQQCSARVQGLSAACAACLSDDVGLERSPGTSSGPCNPTAACPDGECEDSNGFERCTWCYGDAAAELACARRLDPRREIWCDTELDPGVAGCANVCSAQDRAAMRPAGTDPRCAALCRVHVPELDGAYDVCSAQSATDCLSRCAARISGAKSLCASCLLEGARFGTPPSAGESARCEPSQDCPSGVRCTSEGCSWCQWDRAQQESCIRQSSPRREVACPTTFADATRCAMVCN